MIQTELSAQIASGNLPAPQVDLHGNPITYYAVFFPPNILITNRQGSVSCIDYCAYHGTVIESGSRNEYYYAVHPDMQSDSKCASVCGTGNVFENYCVKASTMLTNMITGL